MKLWNPVVTLLATVLFSGAAHAQVTATVVDPDGQSWAYATWTAQLHAPNAPGGGLPNGSVFPFRQTGILTLDGGFSAPLVLSTDYRRGAYWEIALCPLVSERVCATLQTPITSLTQDISGAINSVLDAPRFTPQSGSFGYSDLEATRNPLTPGLSYLNIFTGLRMYNGSAWLSLTGGGGGSVVGGTCTTGQFVVAISTSGVPTCATPTGGGTTPSASAPSASPAPGSYSSTQSVALSSPTAGAVIYYTKDGSTPTTASTVYSGPISVAASQTIKAITAATGFTTSGVATFAYTITAPTGPAHMELASMGQDAKMNGAVPFVGSAVYSRVTNYTVDTANNQYVQTSAAGAFLDTSQPTGSSSSIHWFVLNSKTDPNVFWVRGQTDYDAAGGFDPESDHTLIPMVPGIKGEGDVDITTCYVQGQGDNHGEILDIGPDNPVVYDMYNVHTCNGVAHYYSLSIRNLNHPFEVQGPKGRTSGDVAGMEIIPPAAGMNIEDYDAGSWKHASRWTMHLASKGPNGYGTLYTGIGDHGACGSGNCSDGRATMFGQRMRLKANFDCVTDPTGVPWSAQDIITCNGLKTFGVINADNGINMALQGGYSPRWGDPSAMHKVPITAFETLVDPVETRALAASVLDENDNGGTSTVINNTNIFDYSGGAGPVVPNPIPRPTIVSFTPSATTLAAGQPLTFSYVATDATVVMVDNAAGTGYGNTGTIGSPTWFPDGTTTYRLTVLGQYGWVTGAPVTVTITGNPAPAPTSSVPTGTYTSPQSVALSTTCSACKIHYTLDGSTPNPGSPTYLSPIAIQNNGANVLKAVTTGIQQGFLQSAVSEFDITLNLPSAAAPTFTPAAGSFTSAQSVTMATTTSGAGIYYTLDGTAPTSSSTFYSAPVAVPYTAGVQTRTPLQACTIKYGFATSCASAVYLTGTQGALNAVAATGASAPSYTTGVFGQALVGGGYGTPPAGFTPLNSTGGYTITARIKGPDAGLDFIFGNGDDTAGLAIVARFGRFYVHYPGFTQELDSGISINDGNPHFVKATFSTAGVKTFVDGVAGAITAQVPGAVTSSVDGYAFAIGATGTGRFKLPSTGYIDEVAIFTGVDNSLTVPSAPYTGNESGLFALYHLNGDLTDSTNRAGTPTAATPTFSPAGGTYSTAQTITPSSATSGATLYCTTDGSMPTTSSSVCSSTYTANTGNSPFTLKAIATASGYTTSAVGSATYTINSGGGGGATPTVAGNYSTTNNDPPRVAAVTFTSGNAAIIGIIGPGTGTMSATCGTKSATLVVSQATSSADRQVAFLFIPSVDGGAQNCTTTTGYIESVSEIGGTSGVDSFASSNNTASGTALGCGTTTSAGTNRLGFVIGGQSYASASASSGYTETLNNTGFNVSYISVPTAGSKSLTTQNSYTDNYGCASVLLKP